MQHFVYHLGRLFSSKGFFLGGGGSARVQTSIMCSSSREESHRICLNSLGEHPEIPVGRFGWRLLRWGVVGRVFWLDLDRSGYAFAAGAIFWCGSFSFPEEAITL